MVFLSDKDYKQLSQKLDYEFKDRNLLELALTHKSVLDPKGSYIESNERLEFLGDRVLGLSIADMLIKRFPEENEGQIARRFSYLVSQEMLFTVAKSLDLGRFIIFSTSEKKAGGEAKKSVLADTCEAIIAAIYLDGGLVVAMEFIDDNWQSKLNDQEDPPVDPKTELQEWALQNGLPLPKYSDIRQEGADHDPKFTVGLDILNFGTITGVGSTKRIAQRQAAIGMIKRIKDTNG